MYKLKGTHAYSHGCHIRPGEYVELWREIKRNARELNVSVSEYISHSMHILLMGKMSRDSKMRKR